MPVSCDREKNPAGAFYLVSWGGRRVIFKMGRVLGHIFGSTAVCHPVLIFMPFARCAACDQSRARACGDEQPGPKELVRTLLKNPPYWELGVAGAVAEAERFGHSEALWGSRQK